VSTDLQAFGLIVTAEPYFAVSQPTNMVVLENVIKANTKGWEEPIDAKFELLQKGGYTINLHADQLPATVADQRMPPDLLEAMNAVAIARAAGAERYTTDILRKAEDFLSRAQDYYRRKLGSKEIGTVARGAVQSAEDARLLSMQKRQQEEEGAQRRAEQERARQAQLEAEQAQSREAQARVEAEREVREREQAEQERRRAEQAKAEAERALGCGSSQSRCARPTTSSSVAGTTSANTGRASEPCGAAGRARERTNANSTPAATESGFADARKRPWLDCGYAGCAFRYRQVHIETGCSGAPGQSCWNLTCLSRSAHPDRRTYR